MSEKKKPEKVDSPVPTGHDYRGKEKQIKKFDTTAPDGISGDWS